METGSSVPDLGQAHQALPARPSRLERLAWASLDFANSGYTTVVLTAVFNAYFVSVVMGGSPQATLVWTSILAVSYAVVMITAPWIGALADARACKKSILFIATISCSLSTLALGLVGPGDLWLAAGLLLISNVAYATHQDVSAGFLRELASRDQTGRLSGYGWAWGYLGGLLSLVLSLTWFLKGAQWLGLPLTEQEKVMGSLAATAVLFAGVGITALVLLKERSPPTGEPWRLAWHRLVGGWHDITMDSSAQSLRRFLWCVLAYQAGVATVIALAAIYAQQVMGFGMDKTVLLILVVNLTASVGAALFGWLQDRVGHGRSLGLALWLWIGMVACAGLGQTEGWFWLAANLAGLAMGASQSGARAAVADLAPAHRQAEAFGYWGVAVNGASVLGPLAYGLVTWLTDNDHRLAIGLTGLFFVAGLVLLRRVQWPGSARSARTSGTVD
ncbi:MAG: MFS transporter [Burkholderiaceae bacterium]